MLLANTMSFYMKDLCKGFVSMDIGIHRGSWSQSTLSGSSLNTSGSPASHKLGTYRFFYFCLNF